MSSGPRLVTRDGFRCDLVYSPDDGGWYLQRHVDDVTSQIFDTHSAALHDPIEWDAA